MTDEDLPRVPPDVAQAAASLGFPLEGALGEKLAAFLANLLATNRAFNLTAITQPQEAWTRHVLDSLSLAPHLTELPSDARVADVGSGGGLPGIPLALALPALSFTLVEATAKKASFLTKAARDLQLANVAVRAVRAEDFGQSAARETFDAVTARALSRLPVLLELTLPLLRVGGRLLAIKGGQAQQEIEEAEAALRVLGGSVREVVPTATGQLVIVEKRGPTPQKYPRRPGEPKRSPLR